MGQQKGESIFSYSLTRPYPLPWFTYVIAIGGTVCAVLFSFVALAADGYNLDLEYVTDLNGTLDRSYWFNNGPFSWISKTSVSCQPALLTSGSTYFTGNLGFTYTLDKLWREGSNDVQNRILPATAYLNAQLVDCRVLGVQVDFLRRDQTMIQNNWWTWGATTASATVECGFQTTSGGMKANFTTTLPSVFQYQDVSVAQSFTLSTNITDHADMWFGAQFAKEWYRQLPIAMSYQQIPISTAYSNTTWDSGTVVLSRNPSTNDYTSPDFFYVNAWFYGNNGGLAWIHPPNTTAQWNDPEHNGNNYPPRIITTIDVFAKSLYSLLLSDFGVKDRSNALITAAGIKWIQSRVDDELKGKQNTIGETSTYTGHPVTIENAVNKTGPLYPYNQSYQYVVQDLGTLPNLNNTNATTIFTQYLCSIPQRKGGGALFFAVLLADLVFLQAVWAIANLVATWWVHKKYQQTNYCEGCRTAIAPVIKRKVSDYQPLPANSHKGSNASSSFSLPVIELSEGDIRTTGRES